MSKPLNVETLQIPSAPSELERVDTVTERIAQEMGFSDSARTDIAICVSEAVNNAIVHGHKLRSEMSVDIRFEIYKDLLRVSIRDHGPGFEERSIVDPTRPENLLKVNGRGVHLIHALMDQVEIRHLEDGMEVIMTKRK
jgi:serine/threonine-protein kinase RsbW